MRHFFLSASESTIRPRRRTKLNTLSLREVLRQLESVDYQLKNPLFVPKTVYRALKKRFSDLEKALTDRILEEKYKAKMEALRNPEGLDLDLRDFRQEEENPPRKALCKAVNHGFKRPKPPSPTGKTIGAFRIVRKPKIDKLRGPKR